MNKQNVADCWMAVFPNSSFSHMGSISVDGPGTFTFRLAKDRTEVSNGIMHNDPLYYMGGLEEDGSWVDLSILLLVKPTVPNMVYSSEKMRRKTIKNVTPEKLVKRFQEVRTFVMNNAANLKDPLFDITTK